MDDVYGELAARRDPAADAADSAAAAVVAPDALLAVAAAAAAAGSPVELEHLFRGRTRELLQTFAVCLDLGMDVNTMLMEELAAAGVELPEWVGMLL